MRRWIASGVLLVLAATAGIGYVTLRRDAQYATLIAAGDAAVRDRDSFGAIEAFSGAIALRPSSMLAWLKRGEVYVRRGDHRSAIRDLRQAVALDAAAPRPLELLGDTHTALERYARAADLYEAYLRLDDRDARVQYKLAVTRFYDGRPDAAVPPLRRALGLQENMPEAHYLLGVCLSQLGRHREATAALERAVALSPALVEAHEVLAERYRVAGRLADHVRQLEVLTALDPGQPDRHIALADAWVRAGRPDSAVLTLVRAMERFPDARDLLVALGRVWLGVAEARGDRVALGKAVEALRRAAGRGSPPAALALLGRAQLASGDASAALRSLQQATATLPVDARVLRDLAAAAERAHRFATAREALIREALLAGDDGPARARVERAERIARLSDRLGDRAAAASWRERAALMEHGTRARPGAASRSKAG